MTPRYSVDPKDLYIGCPVFVERTENLRGKPSGLVPTTVSAIGRKWVTLSGYHGRFNAENMRLDGGRFSSPGRVWLHEDEWRASNQLHSEWTDFVRSLSYSSPPKGLTLDQLHSITAIINEAA